MEKESKNNDDDFEESIDEDFIQSETPIQVEEILEVYKTSFNNGTTTIY